MLTIYTENPEILVGNSNGTGHSIRNALEIYGLLDGHGVINAHFSPFLAFSADLVVLRINFPSSIKVRLNHLILCMTFYTGWFV